MKNHIGLYLKFHNENDADIIDYLNGVDNKQGLIKKLIRRYMIKTSGREKQHEGVCKRNEH